MGLLLTSDVDCWGGRISSPISLGEVVVHVGLPGTITNVMPSEPSEALLSVSPCEI